MLYTFLITIVFIAEIIITVTILRALLKLDRILVSADSLLDEAKPSIRDISNLGHKISEQLIEFAEDFRERIKKKNEDTALMVLNKALAALLLWKINTKAIKKFRRSKVGKTLAKGLNLLANMV